MNDHSAMASNRTQVAEPSGKREAILDAALRLFSEHTFDGTAMPLIAEQAKVGAGTIYRYFDSKEALVNAVYRRWKAEMNRILLDEAPRGVTPRTEFGHWWRGLWRFAQENPAAFTFLETHHHESYLDEESRALAVGGHARIRPPRPGFWSRASYGCGSTHRSCVRLVHRAYQINEDEETGGNAGTGS
jgi:AcrR family transcriptional regulator